MNRFMLFLLGLTLLALIACEKFQGPTTPPENNAVQTQSAQKYDRAADQARLEATAAKVEKLLAERQALRQAKSFKPENTIAGGGKITVPDDYPTIQAAVDAATPGMKIKVKAGVYDEYVFVDVAGVRITAEGTVTVILGFVVAANNVQIDGFIIDHDLATTHPDEGILVNSASGVKIEDNWIRGSAFSVLLVGSTNCTVKDNYITGAGAQGVRLANAGNNTIDENTCTGNETGIGLSTSNNNKVSGNTCSQNSVDGILLFIANQGNEFKDNTCNGNGGSGFVLLGANTGNTIGSKNVARGNNLFGLQMDGGASNNVVKKNTFKNNGSCDIVNDGTGNTFIKNTTGCTSGV